MTVNDFTVLFYFSTVDAPRRHRQRAPVSLTASYTSTVAEEIVLLLRKLHSLDTWNSCINQHVVKYLRVVPNILLDSVTVMKVGSKLNQ